MDPYSLFYVRQYGNICDRATGMNLVNSPAFLQTVYNSNNKTIGVTFENLYQAGLLI